MSYTFLRIPAPCEDEGLHQPVHRPRRQQSRSIELRKYIRDHGPVPIKFDKVGGTWKAIGQRAGWFNNALGQHV